MPVNPNLVNAVNQLEHTKSQYEIRLNAGRDENGNLKSDLFRLANHDIEIPVGDWMTQQKERMKQLQAEIDDYRKSDSAMAEIDELIGEGRQRAGRVPLPVKGAGNVSFSDLLFESEGWKSFAAGDTKTMIAEMNVGVKALFESVDTDATDSVNVEVQRTGLYVPMPRTMVTILDLVPQQATTQAAVEYDKQTKNLSAVGPVAQGAVYKESVFEIKKETAAVVKKGAFIQVSEEVLSDVPQLRQRLNGDLMEQMMDRVQDDIVGGAIVNSAEYVSGTNTNDTNITGFLDIADADINRIDGNAGESTGNYKNPISLIREAEEMVFSEGKARVDGILMNSKDWLLMRNLQSTTGAFVLAGANAPVSMPVPRAIEDWPVVLCNSLPKGTVIVGDFGGYCALRDREQAMVDIQQAQAVETGATFAANSALVTKPSGLFNIFIDARYAFYVTRGKAFTRITDFGVAAT